MRVYISCHDAALAKEVATAVRGAGHKVVSDWHDEDGPRPPVDDVKAWCYKASHNFNQILVAQYLVLVGGPETYPGGKHIEAGYAYANDVRVIVLNRRENGMSALFGFADDVTMLLHLLYEIPEGTKCD